MTAVAVPRRLSPFRDSCRRPATAVALPSCAMQAIAAHLSPFRDRRDRDFGRDSRRQGCATGPIITRLVGRHKTCQP